MDLRNTYSVSLVEAFAGIKMPWDDRLHESCNATVTDQHSVEDPPSLVQSCSTVSLTGKNVRFSENHEVLLIPSRKEIKMQQKPSEEMWYSREDLLRIKMQARNETWGSDSYDNEGVIDSTNNCCMFTRLAVLATIALVIWEFDIVHVVNLYIADLPIPAHLHNSLMFAVKASILLVPIFFIFPLIFRFLLCLR